MAETAVDRSNQYLKIVKKDGTFVSVGAKGAAEADIKGLTAGQAVAAGDYQAVFDADATAAVTDAASGKVDVPAFKVNSAAPSSAPASSSAGQ